MGFIGPNGAGKTTTIKLILNLIRKSEGSIRVFGLDAAEHGKEVRQKIGFVFDENFFFEDLNSREIACLMKRFYREWDDHSFRSYLHDFGILPKKKVKELSHGMKTKLSLAVALSHNAELILMDEPTSGLDPIARQEILEIFSGVIQDEERAILVSSHITSDLERIADYVTFINHGKIIFSDNKDEIMDRFRIVQGPKDDATPELVSQLLGFRYGSYGFEGLCSDVERVRPRLSGQCVIEKPDLDQIMIFLAREEEKNRIVEVCHAGTDN